MGKSQFFIGVIFWIIATIAVGACAGQMPTPEPSEEPSPVIQSVPAPATTPSVTQTPANSADSMTHRTIATYTYRVVNTYPHDRNAFTQGLVFEDGVLYEGTGRRGKSTLRRVDLETGDILQIHKLQKQFFGEGITVYEDRIIQLTWQSNIGFVYDKKTFEPVREFKYPTEGWGLTHDGSHLIMSDGTSTLHFLDPTTFEKIFQIEVFDNQGPITRLNELEYIRGTIYANVWQKDYIVMIDPHTGGISGMVNLKGLLSAEEYTQPFDVLNGIAHDTRNDRLFVTGKLWPKLFEIELITQE